MVEDKVVEKQAEPTGEYKNLQRELQKSRDRYAGLMKEMLSKDETIVAMKRVEESNLAILKRLGQDGALGEADDETDIVAELTGRRDADNAASASRKVLLATLDEADVDWSDPRLEGARTKWDAGQFDEAILVVKQALGTPGQENPDFQAAVAAEVQRQMKGTGTPPDSGESTVGGGIPTDPATLHERIRDRTWWKANKPEVMDALQRGLIKF